MMKTCYEFSQGWKHVTTCVKWEIKYLQQVLYTAHGIYMYILRQVSLNIYVYIKTSFIKCAVGL